MSCDEIYYVKISSVETGQVINHAVRLAITAKLIRAHAEPFQKPEAKRNPKPFDEDEAELSRRAEAN